MGQRASFRQAFGPFALVGAAGFVVHALAAQALAWAGMADLPAFACAALLAMTLTWWLNRRWTFASADPNWGRQWLAYLLANGIGALINIAGASAVRLIWPLCPVALAAACGSGLAMLPNFLMNRAMVFGRARP